ncbi:hypothetical protein GOODEAATRI_018924 [Goodea atripinnis]|uniref:Secreted protein n=1 Tax=Goodea atripinnis TaxID=208336 RepID=A0ABV0P629_9TELE
MWVLGHFLYLIYCFYYDNKVKHQHLCGDQLQMVERPLEQKLTSSAIKPSNRRDKTAMCVLFRSQHNYSRRCSCYANAATLLKCEQKVHNQTSALTAAGKAGCFTKSCL